MSSLRELLAEREGVNEQMRAIRESIALQLEAAGVRLNEVEEQIGVIVKAKLKAIRELQAKDYGAVSITEDGIKVTETISKKVKWDQDKLFGIFQKIQSTGDDPFCWMKAEWKVGEKEYNAYPKDIQGVFAPAREVKPGDPKLEFKDPEAPNA